MITINQEVLDNQNGIINQSKAFTEDQLMDHFLHYDQDYKKPALELLQNEGFLEAVSEYVISRHGLKKQENMDFLNTLISFKNTPSDTYVGKTLIDFLDYMGITKDAASIDDYYQEEKIEKLEETVEKQKGYILNLENELSEVVTTISRLQEIVLPPTTPRKPTTKVGWMDRPISQFNKRTGEFIRNWPSARQAERVLGKVNAHAIVEHLKRGSGSSGGYVWRIGQYTEEG